MERSIDDYLDRPLGEVRRREAEAFDEMARPLGTAVVLHGAGRFGRRVSAALRGRGVEPLAFSDGNPSLWGQVIDGVGVLSPEDAARALGSRASFVVTIWNNTHDFISTRAMLLGLGCERVIACPALFYKYPEEFLPYFSMDLPHRIVERRDRVREAYGLMADDESRREFLREMQWRMDLDFSGSPPRPMSGQYFPPDLLKFSGADVFFDCGAFDGDTVTRFLEVTEGSFGKILAFEPDPRNLDALARSVGALSSDVQGRVELHGVAVGARAERVRFDAEGLSSSGVDPCGAIEVQGTTLDAFLGRERPTYIKMDIEGAELDALRGGERLIRESTPALGICVYHRPEDLWEIPLFISALSPAYSLHLRRYAEIPWELVCYGIPRS